MNLKSTEEECQNYYTMRTEYGFTILINEYTREHQRSRIYIEHIFLKTDKYVNHTL